MDQAAKEKYKEVNLGDEVIKGHEVDKRLAMYKKIKEQVYQDLEDQKGADK